MSRKVLATEDHDVSLWLVSFKKDFKNNGEDTSLSMPANSLIMNAPMALYQAFLATYNESYKEYLLFYTVIFQPL